MEWEQCTLLYRWLSKNQIHSPDHKVLKVSESSGVTTSQTSAGTKCDNCDNPRMLSWSSSFTHKSMQKRSGLLGCGWVSGVVGWTHPNPSNAFSSPARRHKVECEKGEVQWVIHCQTLPEQSLSGAQLTQCERRKRYGDHCQIHRW